MWADESLFYHIYPLGYCGAPEKNAFSGKVSHDINKITDRVESIKNLGFNAVYLGPINQSTAHGYDTADYYMVDERLGDKEDFKRLCAKFHEAGIRVVLDGVFNHVGRDFKPFVDVKNNKQNSKYKDWFYIKWDKDNQYNDGFIYKDWEGCSDLVKLNLTNPEVKEHILGAVKGWIDDYGIDGLRLDVAYCLENDFIKGLHTLVRSVKEDFWLMGETLHGDYNQWLNDDMLDSVTNYECYKGMFSSFNTRNMFEIAHSINRQQNLYRDKHLFMFVDNHDVSRIATILKDKRDLKLIYTMMFALPGIPCVYAGSEYGIEGDKKSGDKALRPEMQDIEYTDLTKHIQNLCSVYYSHRVFCYGSYREVKLTNEFYAFERELDGDKVVCAVNVADEEHVFNYGGRDINVPAKAALLDFNGEANIYQG
ncbi:MAG: cyclomaltodextrinase [Lactobacillus sp.]|jgi:glycosidase|nr:cyclomaltodextrinase [Lactobacillus sp.]